MHPFRNELALRERAAIRAHARSLRRRANALFAVSVVVAVMGMPAAYALGMLAGTWASR